MGKGPDKKQRTRKKMTPHDHARRKEDKQMLSKEKKLQFIGHLSKPAVFKKEPDDSAISEDDEQPKEDFSYTSSSSPLQNIFSTRKHNMFMGTSTNPDDGFDDFTDTYEYDYNDNDHDENNMNTIMHRYIDCLQDRLQLECNGTNRQLKDTWMIQHLKMNDFTVKKEHSKFFCQKLELSIYPQPYYRDVKFWLPDMQYNIFPACPSCQSNEQIGVHGYDSRRLVISIPMNYFIVSRRYICHNCAKRKEESVQYTFRGYNPTSIRLLPNYLMLTFPAFFTHKIGIDLTLINQMRPLFDLGIKPSAYRDLVNELHRKEHLRLSIIYEAHSHSSIQRLFLPSYDMMSAFDDPQGYAGYVPSTKWFRLVYIRYMDSIRPHLDKDVKKLPMETLHMDVSYKCAKRITTLSGGERVCQGLVTIMNETAEIRSQFLLSTDAHDQYETPLRLMQDTFSQYGHLGPRYAFVDNPSRDSSWLLSTFPSLIAQQQILDELNQEDELVPTSVASSPIRRNMMQQRIQDDTHKQQLQWTYLYKANEIDSNAEAVSLLLETSGTNVHVGLDAEWTVPINKLGHITGPPEKVCVLQIAYKSDTTSDDIQVVIYHLHGLTKLPPGLLALLQSTKISFVGCGISGDLRKLMRDFSFEMICDHCIDLRNYATRRGIHGVNKSLSALSEAILGYPISKEERLSDWKVKPLSLAMQKYAALDVHASLEIFCRLEVMDDLTAPPIIDSLVPGFKVDICPWFGNLATLGHRVASGIIVATSLSSLELPTHLHFPLPSSVHEKKRKKYMMVQIHEILAPAAKLHNIRLVTNKKTTATFGDIGLVPVTIPIPYDMLRKHVEGRQICYTQTRKSDVMQTAIPKHDPLVPLSNTLTGNRNIECDESDRLNSILQFLSEDEHDAGCNTGIEDLSEKELIGIADEDEHNEDQLACGDGDFKNVEPHISEIDALIKNCDKYHISLPLHSSRRSSPVNVKLDPAPNCPINDKFSSILGSCFHACHRIIVPTHHAYKKPFFVALSEAIFSWDEDDMKTLISRMEDVLKLSEKEILNLRYYKRSFFTKRVKRYVLPPSRLYWRVRAVFECYGPKTDPDSNKLLFNDLCWQKARGILKEIEQGYYSDPPDLVMFQFDLLPSGSIRMDNRLNIPLIKCRRDTNMVENSHKHLLNTFGEFNVGIRFFDAVLAEHRHRGNIKAGIKHRNDFPNLGHYDSWMSELHQHIVLENHDILIYPGLINASEFNLTEEKFGFVDLCSPKLKLEINELVVSDKAQGSEDLIFLRKATGLNLIPLPWSTKEEYKLYPKLLLESQQQKIPLEQLQEWMTYAVLRYVDGITIHPKLDVHNRQHHKKFSRGSRIKNAMTVMAPITAVLESLNNLSSSTLEPEVSYDNPIEILNQDFDFRHDETSNQERSITHVSLFGPLINNSAIRKTLHPPAMPLNFPSAIHHGNAPSFVGGVPIGLPRTLPYSNTLHGTPCAPRVRGKDLQKRKIRRCTRCHSSSCPAAKAGRGPKVICSATVMMPSLVPLIESSMDVKSSTPNASSLRTESSSPVQRPQTHIANFLKSFTDEEKEIVQRAIYGIGSDADVLARCLNDETGFIDSVQRESMRRLKPGKWLNDEIINCFFTILRKRDADLFRDSTCSTKKRSHFFKSFFISKLLDEGMSNRYMYANVKGWSKYVPGGDIFGLDKVFMPVNIGNAHWACLGIFIQERRIQYYDSLGGDGMYYMDAVMQYLKDEWKSKNPGQELPRLSEWKKVRTTIETPKQQNGFDCGVFTCMFADFLSMGYPLSFTQEHITYCRERIALSIMQRGAVRQM